MNPDGSNVTYVSSRYNGKPECPNDLVFDATGNFYVSDFTGDVTNPTGGVYFFSSDLLTVKPVVQNLAKANGISMAPEGNVLWVAETSRNTVLRVQLLQDGVTVHPLNGALITFYSTGQGGTDSNAIDREGNLYQCQVFQGRVVILNSHSIPIANVVVPGREKGTNLGTTNLAFKPGTNEAYLVAAQFGQGPGGAWIFTFKGLAEGLPLFSHR